MDSRAYVFIFWIRTADDVPSDFRAAIQGHVFDFGVFLPQDDAHWFRRGPAYPARLLLLHDRQLSIIAHPASGEAVIDLPLDELAQLETGNILLLGWIHFSSAQATYKLLYNTRASDPLDDFVATLRRRWLGRPQRSEEPAGKIFRSELDTKFRNLLHHSLDRNEVVVLQYFTPPVQYMTRKLIFHRTEFRSGNLLALTSGNRMLWLRDQHENRFERYAGIVVSAPVWLLRSCIAQTTPNGCELKVEFKAGPPWQIPIYDDDFDCRDFAELVSAHANEYQSAPIH